MIPVHCPHPRPEYTRYLRGQAFQLCAWCAVLWDGKMLIRCGHGHEHHLLVMAQHEWCLCDVCHGAMLAQAREREALARGEHTV